mmetsp:Transcript_43086/g.99208  ORF Transcript_43086/g.99208 Transcript_43086/m.99208 type:complete len:992 (-) Transcript_43086:16-2991(-)
MSENGYHTDPDGRSLLYILYVEKVTMLAPGYSQTPVVCRWYADNANHCSKQFYVTTNEEVSAPYFAFMSISFQDLSQRQKYLTLTVSQPEGDHICVAWLDLQTFNVDEHGQLDESGSFATQSVDLQTEQGVYGRIDLHTAIQQRWTQGVPLVPSLEPVFQEPRSDGQAKYLYEAIAQEPVPQEPDTAATAVHAEATEEQARAEAARVAEEEERRRKLQQDEAERARRDDEQRNKDMRIQEELEKARRLREEDEYARRRREDEERQRLYGRAPADSDRERRLHDESVREREREWERQRQREREDDERERRRREEEERYEQQAARQRRYFEEGRNLVPRSAAQDMDPYGGLAGQGRGPQSYDDHLSEASEPCDFVGYEAEPPMDVVVGDVPPQQSRTARAGPRSPTRTSNRAYPRPEAPLNIRLDQIKALSANPQASLYLVKPEDAGLSTTQDYRARERAVRALPSDVGRAGQAVTLSPSRHVSPDPSGLSRGQRRTGASPVHAALATALADVAGHGAMPGAAAEECILRLLVLQKNLNNSKEQDRVALQDAAAGVIPRMLQVLDAAKATCERNQQRLDALSKEKGVAIERLGGGSGYLQPQLKAISKLQAQYTALLASRSADGTAPAHNHHAPSEVLRDLAPADYTSGALGPQGTPTMTPLRGGDRNASVGVGVGPCSTSRPLSHSRSGVFDPGAAGPALPILHAGSATGSRAEPSWPGSRPLQAPSPQVHAATHDDMWNAVARTVAVDGPAFGHRSKPVPAIGSTAVPSSTQETMEADHETMWTALAQNISMSPGTRSDRSAIAGVSVVTSAVSTPRQAFAAFNNEPHFSTQPPAPLRAALQHARGATEGLGPSNRSTWRQPKGEPPSLGGSYTVDRPRSSLGRTSVSPPPASRRSEGRSALGSSRSVKPAEDKYLKILRSLQAKSGSGGGLSTGLAAKLLNKSEVGSLGTRAPLQKSIRMPATRSMVNIMADSDSEGPAEGVRGFRALVR